MANDVITFSGAKLPAKGLAHFKKALQVTSDVAKIEGGIPFLRLVKGSGLFVYGPNDIEVEEGSLWAINPLSMQIGFIAWKSGKPVGKRMKPILEGNPLTRADLTEVGADWDENVSFRLVCIHGEDKGTEVEYQANSYGGRKAFSDLIEAFKAQVDTDPDHIVPVVDLISTSYTHSEFGKVHNPVFEIKKWMAMDAGAAEAEPAGEPEGQPEVSQPKQEPAATSTRRRAAAPVTDVEEQPKEEPKADPIPSCVAAVARRSGTIRARALA
jgi:hypothetical protein